MFVCLFPKTTGPIAIKIYKIFPYVPRTTLGYIGIFCFNIPCTFIMTAIRITSIYVSLYDFPSYNEIELNG